MKVYVRLFGTLAENRADYDPVSGMGIDIPDGSKVKDLLTRLGIRESRGCFVTINSRVADKDMILEADFRVSIFQALAGG